MKSVWLGLTTILGAVLIDYLNAFGVPLICLFLLIVFDMVTGGALALKMREFGKTKILIGVFKKLMYFFLIVVGIMFDILIHFSAEHIGFAYNLGSIFGVLVTIWLLIYELVSVLENLIKLEVPVPKFFLTVAEKFKVAVERKGNDIVDDIITEENTEK